MSKGAYEDTKGALRAAEAVLEILILTAMYYFVWRWVYPDDLFPEELLRGQNILVGLYVLILYTFFHNSQCTLFGQLRRGDLITGQLLALLLTDFITYLQLCLMSSRSVVPVLPMLWLFSAQVLVAVVLIQLYTRLYHRLYAPHSMLLIYGRPEGVDLKIKMDTRPDKYHIRTILSCTEVPQTLRREICRHDAVILNEIPGEIRNDLLKYCYSCRVRAYVAPKLTDIMLRGSKENTLFDTPIWMVRGTGLTPSQRVLKRGLDLVLCAAALPVVLPLMGAIALAIKLEDGGPVFYTQDRLTRHRREFRILKFRSMVVGAERGPVLAEGADPRITRVGRFLRAYRLDELPQLLNILKGDMSLVGPRPERRVLAEQYEADMPEFAYRLRVRGGLTGYAQIYGKYNTSPYDKLRLDMMYIENYSLLLDLKLILLTLQILFRRESTEGADKARQRQQQAQALRRELEE